MSQWEKVGKTKTKTKAQKQKEAERMPKQNSEVTPLEISKSMFGVFEDKRNTGGNQKKPLQDRSNAQGSPKGGNVKKQKKPRKHSPTSHYRYETFEEAIREVSIVGVYEKATDIRGHQVWQKSIINLINDTISCPEQDPAFLSKSDIHFPISKVDEPIKEMMKKLYVDEASEQIRQILFDHCLMTVMELLDRGMPTWGYRLCIQVMAQYAPENCMDDLEKHLSKIRQMQNSQKKCLSYLWAIGQVGIHDTRLGMQIWLTVMMPLLGVKKLAGFVVHYIETLMKITKNPQKAMTQSISADQFFQIVQWIYGPSNGLDSALRERLLSVFGTLRIIATGTLKLKLLIFQRFLRTPVDEISVIKAPIADVAWECVQQNQECLGAWRDLYASSLSQTRILLEHVNSKPDGSKLPNGFQGTILHFHNENMEAAAQSLPVTSKSDFKAVRTLCQNFLRRLEKKTNQSRSHCNMVMLAIFVVLVGVGAAAFIHDVNSHGGKVEKSITYKTLKKYGVLDYMVFAWQKFTTYMQHAIKWLQVTVPYCWSVASGLFGPYLVYIWTFLQKLFIWIIEVTAPVRAVVVSYAEYFLVWADGAVRQVGPRVQEASTAIRPYLIAFSAWLDAKLLVIFSFLKGEIGWCCVRDAMVENASYLYQVTIKFGLFIWTQLLYLGKLVGDYVSGENMN